VRRKKKNKLFVIHLANINEHNVFTFTDGSEIYNCYIIFMTDILMEFDEFYFV
jgi:methyl coenzyme M reductase subunit C